MGPTIIAREPRVKCASIQNLYGEVFPEQTIIGILLLSSHRGQKIQSLWERDLFIDIGDVEDTVMKVPDPKRPRARTLERSNATRFHLHDLQSAKSELDYPQRALSPGQSGAVEVKTKLSKALTASLNRFVKARYYLHIQQSLRHTCQWIRRMQASQATMELVVIKRIVHSWIFCRRVVLRCI